MRVSGITPCTVLDYPEHTACVLFLPGCNMRCKFCHNSEFVLPEKIQKIKDTFLEEDVVFSFLKKRIGKLQGVVISGGEPTVHAELASFIQKIKKLGFKVKLDTNGNNPVRLKQLIDAGLIDYIAMDVKTSVETYQTLVGPMAHPEFITASMDLIRMSGITYEFRSTLIQEFHTPDILEHMAQLFLPNQDILYLQQFRPGTTLDPSYSTYHGYEEEKMKDIASTYFAPHTKQVLVRI